MLTKTEPGKYKGDVALGDFKPSTSNSFIYKN
jgi:hypothetical protein